ncbi:hypothetical protein [Haloactinopolyspora alba]|nr:hypothetical protein [Haloactinopolyspora alba]
MQLTVDLTRAEQREDRLMRRVDDLTEQRDFWFEEAARARQELQDMRDHVIDLQVGEGLIVDAGWRERLTEHIQRMEGLAESWGVPPIYACDRWRGYRNGTAETYWLEAQRLRKGLLGE